MAMLSMVHDDIFTGSKDIYIVYHREISRDSRLEDILSTENRSVCSHFLVYQKIRSPNLMPGSLISSK